MFDYGLININWFWIETTHFYHLNLSSLKSRI
nr:MAG TPA: hypothetical protein [Caudoviricetes sp.]